MPGVVDSFEMLVLYFARVAFGIWNSQMNNLVLYLSGPLEDPNDE